MRIIEIASGKKKLELICGLIWYPLDNNGSAQAGEILKFASINADDLKVVRLGDSPHVGLTRKIDGAKPGQIALAALLGDALALDGKLSCLIAIALPDDANSFIFVAIRDGVILADSDYIGTRDEIKVRLTGDVSYGGWSCVICPDEWGINETTERDLESFLAPDVIKNTKKWELKETKIAWRRGLTILSILTILIGASSFGWKQWKHKQYVAAEALRIQQEEVEMGLRTARTDPPKPWPLMPTAYEFATACALAYQKTNTTAGNWNLDNVICENQAINFRWAKTSTSAWSSHLALSRPDLTITPDGLLAYLNVPLNVVPSNDFSSLLPAATGIQISYLDIAARMGINLHIDAVKATGAPPPLPGLAPGNVPATASSWAELAINIDSTIEPLQVVTAINRPGLRISKIEYILKSGAPYYKLTGVQYVSN
jgi:hypothetical protein